eukprot:jgi/Mesvir1/18303/Mv18458-RA.1
MKCGRKTHSGKPCGNPVGKGGGCHLHAKSHAPSQRRRKRHRVKECLVWREDPKPTLAPQFDFGGQADMLRENARLTNQWSDIYKQMYKNAPAQSVPYLEDRISKLKDINTRDRGQLEMAEYFNDAMQPLAEEDYMKKYAEQEAGAGHMGASKRAKKRRR